MYHWIEDKDFLGRMRKECSDVVNRLVTIINNDDVMSVEMHMVGSGAKNMETQNENEPVDLDYNINVLIVNSYNINDCKNIKEYIRKKFNQALKSKGWRDCKDSTSALTTGQMYFLQGNQTRFSIDLAITFESNNKWYRLIHNKTGLVSKDEWIWNEGPNSSNLIKKVKWLKKNNYWKFVRDTYLDRKNKYLRRGDNNHPLFNCYIEAVNEIYNKYGGK